jgi:membrane-associated phospholipid phosphatase
MLDALLNLDTSLFFLINRDLQNRFFDILMPVITNERNWIPVFLVIIVGLLWKGGRKGRTVVLLLIPLILLSDQLSSSLFKPLFDRMRPCEAFGDLGMVNMLVGMKTSPSFPSGHATNSMAVALFFAHFYPRRRLYYFIAAAAVAFSRVYVGVHYPLDILAGALLGCGCAVVVYGGYEMWLRKRANGEKRAPG